MRSSFGTNDRAFVAVARDYLQDYASLRATALVQGYYEIRHGHLNSQEQRMMNDEPQREFRLPGRLVVLHFDPREDPPGTAQVWGVRFLVGPGESPITAERWDYARLDWPGLGTLSRNDAMALHRGEEAYVRDEVLSQYEGRPGFSIQPESGVVSYQGQWSVGYTRRVDRDVIAVEIRKLYETSPPDVVLHWNQYAVAPPARPSLGQDVATDQKGLSSASCRSGKMSASSRLSHSSG